MCIEEKHASDPEACFLSEELVLSSADDDADIAVQPEADQTTDDEMGGIIEVEEPFHTLPYSALAVVLFDKRHDQQNEQLEQTIDRIDKDCIDSGIDGDPFHHADGLLFEISAVGIDFENRQYRNAAPVGTEGNHADAQNESDLLPLFQRNEGVLGDCNRDNAPGERPDHTGLIEHGCLKRNKRNAEGEVVGKVGDDSKRKQSADVFFQVMGMRITLRDHKPENRCGEPSDDMQQENPPRLGISRYNDAGHMVYSHGKEGDQF